MAIIVTKKDKQFGLFLGGVVLFIAALSAVTLPAKTPVTSSPATKEDDTRAGLSLAGTLVNFTQFCPREFAALTPQYQNAVMTYIKWEVRDNGKDAVKQAVAHEYQTGYYSLGKDWCSIGASTARSIASAMTR